MDSREVGDLLEECARALTVFQKPTEAERLHYCSCKDSLCSELASLLKEAVDMKWPFVPEKWQYKQSVGADDKTNLSDLISKHLSQLLTLLKASILAQEACTALAVVFLVDRFLYWIDESGRLLKITKLLHRHHPRTPVAPQLVLRQARLYLNSGKLQKAEYILSSLINYSGATGCWAYHSECDRALVQAVSVQVRGMSLQKLGLWLQAAELIWASLVGFYALPQPDKKGIGTSLGILANILVSMNDEDFHTFSSSPDIDLSLLGDRRHRLLSAAQAAKMAVVYSQYTSLYVLTNVVTQGTCLLSYSFSVQCPVSQRQPFLLQARETFSIGLLTKAQGQLVRSKQELHTFLKAAYSLTVTHKWLGTSREAVAQATQACQKALATFYEYCNADTHDKDGLCAEIMHWVAQVKLLLQVEPFPNSDIGSFIPDSFKVLKDTSVNFTLEGFAKVMQRFQKYHASLCETTNTNCKGDHIDGTRLCITALGTTVGTLNTECSTEACKVSKGRTEGQEPQQRGSKYSSDVRPPQHADLCTTLGSTDVLGSSWDKFSLSSSGNIAMEREANASDRSCLTTGFDGGKSNGMLQSADKNKKRESQGCNSGAGSHIDLRNAMPATSCSNASSHSEKFELIQAAIETLATEDNWMADIVGVPREPSTAEEAVQSLSQLNLKTSSSSLGDSFGSQSSWEKISADPNSPTITKPQPSLLLKAGTNQSSKSPDGYFFLMETLASETPDSAHDPTQQNHPIGLDVIDSRPGPLESLNVDPDMQTKGDSVRVEHVNKKPSATPHQKRTSIENSMESSFEMLEECQNGDQRDEVTSNEKVTPSCYSCQKPSIFVPERQYLLTQQDYQALLAGVCHDCLLRRLQSDETEFKLKKHRTAYSALHLKFSKATGLWTARETCVYIGEPMGMEGKQRMAIWVQFLHQEERLSSYVGKDYLKPKKIQFHLKDVERQMTAQHYVTEFNKSLYDKEVMAQIFFIPSEALLILNGDEIVGCVTVEPYMLGDFVKLTNNTGKKDRSFQATEYGLAFGHFTYLFSDCKEVVVDLQGWVTANGKGLTYLTDPQIHSTKTPKGASNFAARGLRYFLEEQHGPECNAICQLLKLPPVERKSHDLL